MTAGIDFVRQLQETRLFETIGRMQRSRNNTQCLPSYQGPQPELMVAATRALQVEEPGNSDDS
jgi:hypothetical protein